MSINRLASDVELKDVIDLAKRDIFLTLNCHAIATVESFDSTNRTVTATINYKKSLFLPDSMGVYQTVLRDYPILIDCPVIVLGGGLAEITFPIAPGDECVILFNDRDIDTWFAGTSSTAPPSLRLHSMSDGIALIGLRSLARATTYDETRAVLKFGTTLVGVGESKVKIANNSTTLNTLLASLIDAIENILIDVNSVSPGGGVVSVASKAALTTIKTNIAGLLE